MFLLEESIKLLWKILEEGKANKEHTNKQHLEFLKVASKAVRRTLSYIRDENKRNTKIEEELSDLWADVAVAAQPFDPDLANRCYIKGNYWANPDKWQVDKVEEAGIEIERIEAEIGNYFKGRVRIKKSKQQKTIEKPENLPNEELSNAKENNKEFGHETIKISKPWYKTIWAIVAGLIIFMAALTTLILNFNKIKEKFTQNNFNKTTTETKSDESKFSRSPKEICEDIRSRPVFQQEDTAKYYTGLMVRWSLRLKLVSKLDEKTVRVLMRTDEFLEEQILFTVEISKYPQIKFAKENTLIWVSGEIKKIEPPLIHLSNVSLVFE